MLEERRQGGSKAVLQADHRPEDESQEPGSEAVY